MAKTMAASETEMTYTKTVAKRSHFLLFFWSLILLVSFDLFEAGRLVVLANLDPDIVRRSTEAPQDNRSVSQS